jgi:hypothetical protein
MTTKGQIRFAGKTDPVKSDKQVNLIHRLIHPGFYI